MTIITYVRAGASCLPIVGPLIGQFNALEVKQEMSFAPLHNSLSNMHTALTALSVLVGNADGSRQVRQDFLRNSQANAPNRHLSVSQKGRLYSICSLVGNVLSIATVVGLVAFGIWSTMNGAILVAGFIVYAGVSIYNLHQYNRTITAFQAT